MVCIFLVISMLIFIVNATSDPIRINNSSYQDEKLNVNLISDQNNQSLFDKLMKEGKKEQINGDNNKALNYFFQALDTGIVSQKLYTGIGYSLISLGEYDNATLFLKKALVLDPDFEDAKKGLKEISECKQTEDLSSFNELVNAGNEAQKSKNFNEALNYFNQALEMGIKRDDAYAGIGFALTCLGEYDNATEFLNKALELNPNFEPAKQGLKEITERIQEDKLNQFDDLVQKGNTAQMEGYYNDAINYFNQALEIGIEREDAYVGIGLAMTSLGEYDNATEFLNKALKIDPLCKPAKNGLEIIDHNKRADIESLFSDLVNQGNMAQTEGDYDGAIYYFNQALEMGIEREDAYAGIGFALTRLGEYDNATPFLKKALELDPFFKPAREGLSIIKEKKKEYNQSTSSNASKVQIIVN